MADCKYTCFDRVINLTSKVPANKLEELYELITDYGLTDVLDFGVENNCFTESQRQTLYDFIIMWEDLDGNYYEEEPNKLVELYEAMGVVPKELHDWQVKHNE